MNMQFDVEILDWINWIAQDEDGGWYGYEEEPTLRAKFWNTANVVDDTIQLAHCSPPKDFTRELYEIIR